MAGQLHPGSTHDSAHRNQKAAAAGLQPAPQKPLLRLAAPNQSTAGEILSGPLGHQEPGLGQLLPGAPANTGSWEERAQGLRSG